MIRFIPLKACHEVKQALLLGSGISLEYRYHIARWSNATLDEVDAAIQFYHDHPEELRQQQPQPQQLSVGPL